MNIALHDPRPNDPAQLACEVAAELRKRGIWARSDTVYLGVVEYPRRDRYRLSLMTSEFDNLGPIAIADEIQRQEAARAQEWAGDM